MLGFVGSARVICLLEGSALERAVLRRRARNGSNGASWCPLRTRRGRAARDRDDGRQRLKVNGDQQVAEKWMNAIATIESESAKFRINCALCLDPYQCCSWNHLENLFSKNRE